MSFQQQVPREFRAKEDIERANRVERLGTLTGQIQAEIDAMKGLPDGEYRSSNLHNLETELRRLADCAQVALNVHHPKLTDPDN